MTGRVKSLESCLAEESAACQQAQRTLDGAQELVDLQSAKSLNEVQSSTQYWFVPVHHVFTLYVIFCLCFQDCVDICNRCRI